MLLPHEGMQLDRSEFRQVGSIHPPIGPETLFKPMFMFSVIATEEYCHTGTDLAVELHPEVIRDEVIKIYHKGSKESAVVNGTEYPLHQS